MMTMPIQNTAQRQGGGAGPPAQLHLDDPAPMRRQEDAAIATLPRDVSSDSSGERTAYLAWSVPADGRAEDLPAWRAFTGQSREAVRGQGWLAAVHPQDRSHAVQLWEQALRTQAPFAAEYRIRRRDGAYRWFSIHAMPLCDAEGRVSRWAGSAIDITKRQEHAQERDQRLALVLAAQRVEERNRLLAQEQSARTEAEAALARAQASESQVAARAEELHTILETIADGVCLYDAEGRLQLVNRAYRELHAMDRGPAGFDALPSCERVRMLNMRDGTTGAPLSAEDIPAGRALRGEVVTAPGADVRVRAFDGRELEVNVSAAPLRQPDGRIAGAVVVVRDVTERNRLAREREAARADELAARETSRRMEDFLATSAHDLRNPVLAADGYVQLALQRLEQVKAGQAGGAPPAAPAPAGAETEAPAGARRRRAADPMQALDESLRAAAQGTERLSRMVKLLFDEARARAGTLDLQVAPCDLAALVREQVEAQRMATPDRTILLELPGLPSTPGIPGIPGIPGASDRPEGLPVSVLADADRLSQVLANYLTNALKYSSDDAPVSVRLHVEEDGRLARVAVRDAGPGLPPEEQQRIWEPFRRVPGVEAQNNSAGKAGSLGLGLHICKTIVEAHGGQVGVESAVGQGSTFWFRLPVAARDEAAPHRAS